MLRVENKSEEEIAEIGRKTEYFYKAGVLYATSEAGEGYLAYWEKKKKPPIGPALNEIKRFLCELPLAASLAVARSGGEQYAKIFKKERNYIVVSMVVVLREFQGKGFMHKILEQPFAEADEKNIPCVLDTDTPLKVEKYIRCGMELAGEKKLRHGASLYAMAYNVPPEGGQHP